jgi:hypothetical protein
MTKDIANVQPTCAQCKNPITSNYIIAVKRDFCSEVCHLRFWKEEMPNLGGQWITDEALEILGKLKGGERNAYYSKIISFIMNNFDSTTLMSKVIKGAKEGK